MSSHAISVGQLQKKLRVQSYDFSCGFLLPPPQYKTVKNNEFAVRRTSQMGRVAKYPRPCSRLFLRLKNIFEIAADILLDLCGIFLDSSGILLDYFKIVVDSEINQVQFPKTIGRKRIKTYAVNMVGWPENQKSCPRNLQGQVSEFRVRKRGCCSLSSVWSR